MKANGEQAKIGAAIAKGEAPFDAAKVQTIFATFVEAAEKAPALFPDNSKTGGKTEALPSIWKNKADLEARLAKFGADAKAAHDTTKDAKLKALLASTIPVLEKHRDTAQKLVDKLGASASNAGGAVAPTAVK